MRDAGQVEPGLEQVADAAQPVQVIGAVAAGAALGALGFEQPARLVGAQVLHPRADQFGGDRDAIHATRRVRFHRRPPHHVPSSPDFSGISLLRQHATSAISNL